ncbi:MAG: hypothetical protein OXL41_04705 [Nitrospinae bacterium]|nr:hypothetical protein [Nitrospinota bacterium]
MFANEQDKRQQATNVAKWLANHKNFKSHARHIPRDELIRHGLKIEPLEADGKTQDLSLSVFHAATQTFSGTGAIKIIENNLGRAFIKNLPPLPGPGPALKIDIGEGQPQPLPN